jgi:hypothetical protein
MEFMDRTLCENFASWRLRGEKKSGTPLKSGPTLSYEKISCSVMPFVTFLGIFIGKGESNQSAMSVGLLFLKGTYIRLRPIRSGLRRILSVN